MKPIAILLATSALAVMSAVAHPVASDGQLSQEDIRATLITKHNVAEYLHTQRQQKAMTQKLPAPFVVSTSLNVKSNSNNRQSRTNFNQAAARAVVVDGIRMPDDESDQTTWRNGRVINNMFVPNSAVLPEEVKIMARQPKSYNFDDFYQGQDANHRRRLPDNMAVESRSDTVYVEAPDQFKVGS
jgi:hypothetical protein